VHGNRGSRRAKRVPAVLAALLSAVSCAAPCAAQDGSATSGDELYREGCLRLEQGRFTAAVQALSAALARQPDRGDFALKLAQAYRGAGQGDEARKLLENFLARQPADQAVRLDLAQLHVEQRRPAAAAELLAPFLNELEPAGLILLAEAFGACGRADEAAEVLSTAVARFPGDEPLWLAYVDQALEQRRHDEALHRVRGAEGQLGSRPGLHFRAAIAHFELGRILGEAQRRTLPSRRSGQFQGDLLLIADGEGAQQFLCCPPESAMYQIRRALDGGLDEPAAHVLHARIWQRCGRPEVGLAILLARKQALIESNDEAAIRALADLALAAGRLPDYLRYARLLARCRRDRTDEILGEAFLAAAERYNQRGEEVIYAALLRRALELKPQDAALRLRLADADWDAGRTAAAARNYHAVLEQERDHPERLRILRRLEEASAP
jgi:predicted Zn-dependent protease